jgi:hypothetical protein
MMVSEKGNFSNFVIPIPAFVGENLSPRKWGVGI